MAAVTVNNLIKSYGKYKAVDDFSFDVAKGELVALVGPDGAGKTSIFRSICNLIDYDSGEIFVAGKDQKSEFEKIKPLLGYMPQNFSLYPDLSVEENLNFYAGLFGLSRSEFNHKKESLYNFSGLKKFAGRRAVALSGGMKQKLALSCNLIHDPKILILDEPTTGVDPLSRRQFWGILKKLQANGSTIVVSTPYMDEVEQADRSIFIFNGIKLADGSPSELTRLFKGKVYKLDIKPTTKIMHDLNQLAGIVVRRFGSSIHLYLNEEEPIERYSDTLGSIGISLDTAVSIKPELEDTFIQLMGN